MDYKYMVVNKETRISVKFFVEENDAQDLADFMTDYHKEEFEVKVI